ncbi:MULTISPECIES: GNAT family N-acetyltransferase [unclassified Streptomyces]|uniref:GNAT family N-acetyltransferase n=1 Tax=unclassified Streptomyces TaxID=2593676 RepID=UPI001E3DFB79|nr:GNAT family N-acetyltransferase [Streptomyces sp. MBT42]MCD2463458.1 GNAT family N-acetyltransferase [Streptomyces sp. MBT42]
MNATVLLAAPATPTAPALVLRSWRADDVAELVEAYRDPALRRWAVAPIGTEDEGLAWVRAQEEAWAAGGRLAFAVVEAPSGGEPRRLAGGVVLKGVAPGTPSAEVGYWTAARTRGRGVAPRALEALTAWAFDSFRADGLERLELLHQADNTASCRVAEKCGYAFDRTLPAAPPAFPLDGHLHVRERP